VGLDLEGIPVGREAAAREHEVARAEVEGARLARHGRRHREQLRERARGADAAPTTGAAGYDVARRAHGGGGSRGGD